MTTFGLIGCGYISKRHIQSLAECPNACLVAVSDIQEERMKQAASLYQESAGANSSIHHYGDYHHMMKDSSIDVIIIATSSLLHAPIAKEAIEHGKHVIIEKPLALSIEDANDIIEWGKKHNRHVMVCHQMRFRPIMQKIKDVVTSGKIGKPYLGVASMRINRSEEYYTSAPWRGDWEKDGGMLINQGIHVIDLLQWFLGDVKSVYGDISRYLSVKETEDVALGVLTFENEAKGIIEANVITQPNNIGYSLSIFGEKGTISIEGSGLDIITRWYVDGEENDSDVNELLNDHSEHLSMYQQFLEVINTQIGTPLVNGTEGKKALETIFALYQSALEQKIVTLPLDHFSTAHMKRKED
ncbi:Gfo/Idh/MocA family oxidoreductase [Priestia koreensis]|uniref:Gfo/Idh/MocA family protein n=1 Tax=Priestia koreensis TaxID=284581 RepID=UPI0028F6E3EC|nr:Gfo/Idh/MocA family oxidoreductase [Priestia koreensis]